MASSVGGIQVDFVKEYFCIGMSEADATDIVNNSRPGPTIENRGKGFLIHFTDRPEGPENDWS